MSGRKENTDRSETLPAGALILAAGFSRRFGGIKLHAKLSNGLTVFEQTLTNISAATDHILVVTRADLADSITRAVHSRAPLAQITVCPDSDKGMGNTLAHGVQQIEDWRACMICLGDMPFVNTDTYRQLLIYSNPHTIAVPRYEQKIGNPISFGHDFFEQISLLQGDAGARRLLQQYPDAVHYVDVNDKAILQDIDTPEDIQRWDTTSLD
ncbi:MAG: nucleotidyltransferase family protein [Pseudohongiellaceae bacterium]|nr:nucleotidyltransferase family protein [Pseudohongiellaceae bacterium]